MAEDIGGRIGRNPGPRRRLIDAISFVLLLLSGLGLALPGIYLISLGGSAYYLVAGLVILLCALLVLRGRPEAPWLFAALLLATLIWSIAEVGLDGWALMPRLVFLVVAALWLFLTARPQNGGRARRAQLIGALGTVALVAVLAGVIGLRSGETPPAGALVRDAAPAGAAAGEWDSYGGSARATRYSALAEITPANVGRMSNAWIYRTGLKGPDGKRNASLELTPLMADGMLYGCTAFSTVFAIDPVSGRQIWRTEHKMGDIAGGHPVCRGVAFFRAPAGTADCPTRILLGTLDNKLIALDARTGAPCRSFGRNGQVDLLDGVGHYPQGWSHPTSPPTIVNGTAVIGAFVIDNQSTDVPPGVIRGYDAVTGAFKWAFDPGRPDDHAAPPPGRRYTPSTPNSWTVFSGDPKLNLVYVPMGNGSPDFFGHSRTPATERFSTSLVALDAATGAVRWTFQAVHHDLWDYDLAAQPALVDLPQGNGAAVPALVLPSKNGQIFLLDRRTGQPLSRVAERPAPASVMPGERASPTQPASLDMPDFAGPPLHEADMWGMTPFDQLYCRIRFRQAVYQGEYTPLQLRPTLRSPGELGGVDWGSVSIDEGRGLLIVNSNRMADRDQLITRAQANAEHLVPKSDPRGHFAPGGAMAGTPFAVHWGPFLTGFGIPCQRPPYGLLTAVDLRTHRIVWQHPIGDARNSGPFGFSLGLRVRLGAPNIGGSVATGGGLVFIAATQDEMFRAIDVRSGRVLWQTKLPAAGHATPMTYRGRDGHQYVVIAAGGQSLQDKPGDYLMAFRLGKSR